MKAPYTTAAAIALFEAYKIENEAYRATQTGFIENLERPNFDLDGPGGVDIQNGEDGYTFTAFPGGKYKAKWGFSTIEEAYAYNASKHAQKRNWALR